LAKADHPRFKGRGILAKESKMELQAHGLKQDLIGTAFLDETFVPYDASMLHLVKSISWPHPGHTCLLSNSSENISFSFPQLGHLQINALRFCKSSNPGQCLGVVMIASRLLFLPRQLLPDLPSIFLGHLHTTSRGGRFQFQQPTHHIHPENIFHSVRDAIGCLDALSFFSYFFLKRLLLKPWSGLSLSQ
jgi:hypothetical protein